MAWPPPRSPVITVSATHEARQAATAASAALPPAARISTPASAVAGCPAATAAFTRVFYRALGSRCERRHVTRPRARPGEALRRHHRRRRRRLRRREGRGVRLPRPERRRQE